MSFTTLNPTASSSGGGVRALLPSPTLGGVAITLGITAIGIVLSAGHYIAVEEGRNMITRLRAGRAMRRERNTAVLCALIASNKLPLDLMQFLEKERDVFRAAIRVSLDSEVPAEVRVALSDTLRDLYVTSRHKAD